MSAGLARAEWPSTAQTTAWCGWTGRAAGTPWNPWAWRLDLTFSPSRRSHTHTHTHTHTPWHKLFNTTLTDSDIAAHTFTHTRHMKLWNDPKKKPGYFLCFFNFILKETRAFFNLMEYWTLKHKCCLWYDGKLQPNVTTMNLCHWMSDVNRSAGCVMSVFQCVMLSVLGVSKYPSSQ